MNKPDREASELVSQTFEIIEHGIPAAYLRDHPFAQLDDTTDLTLHVKQYKPRQRSDEPFGITIVLSAGTALQKELYEPLLASLVASLSSQQPPVSVNSIWACDPVFFRRASSPTQSDSLLDDTTTNNDKLGLDPSWNDHTRDMATMIQHFRRAMPKPIYGLSHSMGCASLLGLASWHPGLFDALIMVESGGEPTARQAGLYNARFGLVGAEAERTGKMVQTQVLLRYKGLTMWVERLLAAVERDRQRRKVGKAGWATRGQGEEWLRQKVRSEKWREDVVERLLRHGVYRDAADGRWKLTVPVDVEMAMLFRPNQGRAFRAGAEGQSAMVTFEEDSRPERQKVWSDFALVRCPVLFVDGARPDDGWGSADTRALRVRWTGSATGASRQIWGDDRAVRQVMIEGARHACVFDRSLERVAEEISSFLAEQHVEVLAGEKRKREWRKSETVRELPDGYLEVIREKVEIVNGRLKEAKSKL